MLGSLAYKNGVLYVGRFAKTAHVSWYDLDGRVLGRGFSYRDPALSHAAAAGIAVDDDRRLWVADTPAHRVRAFNVFGNEVAGLGGRSLAASAMDPGDRSFGDGGGATATKVDAAGAIHEPVDVDTAGGSDDLVVCVALGGKRRHAVQLFDASGEHVRSLRPKGDAHGQFNRVRGVALEGRFVYVCEGGWKCVQVFRDGDFHFAFRPRTGRGGSDEDCEPRAVAPLPDGRVVVACGSADGSGFGGGGLFLFDQAGRLQRILAEPGAGEGAVFEPADVAVRAGDSDRETLVAVLDQDGDRVQVFTLEGRCYGAFEELAS